MDRESGLHDRNKRKFPNRRQPVNLLHAKIFSTHSLRQLPLKPMQQVGQATPYHFQSQSIAGAHPPTRPEWQQLKALALDIHSLVQEPLGSKLLRLVPHGRVSPHAPRVYKDHSALADVVAADVAVLESQMWGQQNGYGVLSHGLFDY